MHGTHDKQNPIDTLKNEHRVIEKVLVSLRRFSAAAAREGTADRSVLGRYVEFFREFADRCHHGKEETHLFAALTEHGIPEKGGPVGVMLREHEMGRSLVRELGLLANGDGPLTAEEARRLPEVAGQYASLLEAHIQKEDAVLFPMASQVLPPAVLQELSARFEKFERDEMGEGAHEALHAEAAALAEPIGPAAAPHSSTEE